MRQNHVRNHTYLQFSYGKLRLLLEFTLYSNPKGSLSMIFVHNDISENSLASLKLSAIL